jgi:transposase
MIHLPASVRVYLCLTACDMRKSFDGLHALVREHLELDVFAGHLFVFASRQCGARGWKKAPTRCRFLIPAKCGARSLRKS